MGQYAQFPATDKFNANKPLLQWDEEKVGENAATLTAYTAKKGELAIPFPTAAAATLFFSLLSMQAPAFIDANTPLVIYIPTLAKVNDTIALQVSQRLSSAADYLTLLKIRNELIETVLLADGLNNVRALVGIVLQYCFDEKEDRELTADAALEKYPDSGITMLLTQRKAALLAAPAKPRATQPTGTMVSMAAIKSNAPSATSSSTSSNIAGNPAAHFANPANRAPAAKSGANKKLFRPGLM